MTSKYFSFNECKCKGTNCCGQVAPMDHQFMAVCDALRLLVGPLNVTSAFRCRTWNSAVGGAPESYHMRGLAMDVFSKTKTPAEIADYAEKLGLNAIVYDTFCHIDGRFLQ